MAHLEQRQFTIRMKAAFPSYFRRIRALDVGSADINGNSRFLFDDCEYTGIDLWDGPNVDMVCSGHEMTGLFHTVISCNSLEHDCYYQKTILNMVKMTHKEGMLLISVPTTGYKEHGTRRTEPFCSPLTTDYYKNLTYQDIEPYLSGLTYVKHWVNEKSHDMYVIGFKNTPRFRPSLIHYIWIELKYFFWARIRDFRNAPGYLKMNLVALFHRVLP